ncbi:exodeoxyribonuclease VII large subunit [Oceanobacillus sp. CAU 1775]
MKDKYLTVTALTRYIKRKIDMDNHLQDLWLKGEISNFNHHSRGHMYLTIKDEQSRIQAVMFAGNNRHLKFLPENGMKVFIRGNISVYEANGQYQLYINEMEPDGIGALYLAYEQLKEKLAKKGYFDLDHKKVIPEFPEKIGVITSPTGAAVRDVITTIKRRYPIVEVVVIPVLVQGPNAPLSIKNAIEQANAIGDFDVLIVGRGGGSIEELWSFNEEIVATAIYDSEIPIISAVGHETDTTISDFVADLRAPTPTSAAEMAVPSQNELKTQLSQLNKRSTLQMNRLIDMQERQLNHLKASYAFRYPGELLKQKEQELDLKIENLNRNMALQKRDKVSRFQTTFHRMKLQHPESQLNQAEEKLKDIILKQEQAMSNITDDKLNKLGNLVDKLSLVNPLDILKRGFALPYNKDKELIKSTSSIKEDDLIHLKLTDGSVECRVLTVEENENG